MKRVISFIFVVASVAALLVGCAKEVRNNEPEAPETHTVTFVSDNTDSRTQIVEGETEASYIWLSTDAQYLHIKENGNEATSTTLSLNSTGSIGTISATFTNTSATSFVYKGYYYGEKTNSGNPKVLETQNPKNGSYDPKSDVLISDETEEGPAQDEIKLRFGRVAVINKMVLRGMVSGEKVSKVTLTGSVALNGSYAEATTNQETGEPVAAKWNAGSKKLIFEDFENDTVDSNGEFTIFFVSIPFEGTISISVTTDQNQYDRDDIATTLKFAVGNLTRIRLNLSGYGEPITTGATYELVGSQSELTSGATYLLAGGDTYVLGEQKSNNRAGVSVTPNNGTITVDNTIAAYPLVIESVTGGYTIKDVKNNKYLYTNNTSANRLLTRDDIGDDNYAVWTITITSGIASISNVGNTSRGILCFNPNNDSPMFAAYGTVPTSSNGTADLALYVDPTTAIPSLDTPTGLSAESAGSGTVNVSWNSVSDASSYTVTMTGQDTKTGITTTSTSFIGVADGNYTITVTAISADQTVKKNSAPSETAVTVGTPTLAVPANVAVAQSLTGITASWNAVENATSYSWALYDDSGKTSLVACGTVNTNSLSSTIANNNDWDIDALVGGTIYYFTVAASANGYTSSAESSAASFEAIALSNKVIDYTAQGYSNSSAVTTLNDSPIFTTLAKGSNANNAPKYYNTGTAVRMYEGNTLTIESSKYIRAISFTISESNNSLSANVGTYSGTSWSGKEKTVVFTCGSSQTRIQSMTVYYEDDGSADPVQLVMGDISCTNSGQEENTLSYSWSAVEHASGYQVSEDGSSFGDTQNTTTYTLSGLSANSSHTIWVKAVGDGTNYLTSAAKESAVGTTKANGNDGTQAHPYTVTEALTVCAGLSSGNSTSSNVYVSGIVTTDSKTYNSSYSSLTYYISVDGTETDHLQVYGGKYVGNSGFSSSEQLCSGAEVIVYGKLKNFNGTYEFDANNYIYSLNGLTSLPSVTKTDITGVSADGIEGATTSVSFSNNSGWDIAVAGDGTIVTAASLSGTTITYTVNANTEDARTGAITITFTRSGFSNVVVTIDVGQLAGNGNTAKWNLVSSLSDIKDGKYAIAALNNSKYYTVPNTTISAQTFTCTEASYSAQNGLTLPTGAGEFTFTAVSGVNNAYYIYNTNLKKYLVATGSKAFGYVDSNNSNYGYWTFSTVSSGGFSGVFSVTHSSKTHYMRAYSNSVRCYDGASNNGVYLFIYE